MPHDTVKPLNSRTRQLVFGMMVLGASLGLVAATVLSYEALVLARQADAVLGCDLNSVLSCGTVGRHWSASLLGIPNAFIGMIAFPVFLTIGVLGFAGARLPQWIMKAAQAGAVASVIFAGWMFYMSFAVIGALCPWCLTTDLGTLLVAAALIRHNALTDNLCARGEPARFLKRAVQKQYDLAVLWLMVVLVVMAILIKYGSALL